MAAMSSPTGLEVLNEGMRIRLPEGLPALEVSKANLFTDTAQHYELVELCLRWWYLGGHQA